MENKMGNDMEIGPIHGLRRQSKFSCHNEKFFLYKYMDSKQNSFLITSSQIRSVALTIREKSAGPSAQLDGNKAHGFTGGQGLGFRA